MSRAGPARPSWDMAADASPLVVCDVAAARSDAPTVDALARLALLLRRDGRELQLARASPELRELVAFMGLAEVLRS